jgi:hypothetical protein
MLQRKIKNLWVKYKLRQKRETQIKTITELLNLEGAAHLSYLKHSRHKEIEKVIYQKGIRDGIRMTWK